MGLSILNRNNGEWNKGFLLRNLTTRAGAVAASVTTFPYVDVLTPLHGDLAWAVTVNMNSRCAGVQRLRERA